MEQLKYVVYREGPHFVSQGLNVDVSSFGSTIEESVANLKEAVELLLEDAAGRDQFHPVGEAMIGAMSVNAKAA